MLEILCGLLHRLLASALAVTLAVPVVDLVYNTLFAPPIIRPTSSSTPISDLTAKTFAKTRPVTQPPPSTTTAMFLLRTRARTTETDIPTNSRLLMLPMEIIESIVQYLQPNHPGAILNFALTCTSTFPISLPILYSSIRISNLSLLPDLAAFLAATPSLAPHVHSITASPTCTHSLGYISHAIDQYCPYDELGLARTAHLHDSELGAYLRTLTQLTMLANKIEKQCSPAHLQSLPLPLLTHLARICMCPNLQSVDLSAMPVHAAPHFVTYGARHLVKILRQRRGKLHCPWFPFSSISLSRSGPTAPIAAGNGEGALAPEVYGIVGVDWGTNKRLTVVCITSAPWLKHLRYPVDYCLVPVQELVAEDEMVKREWTVVDLPTGVA